jgi:apolipoprotein N-acyltransferase
VGRPPDLTRFSLLARKLLEGYRSTFGQALTGAALLWAALPPAELWVLAWIAPIWWVGLIRRRQLPGRRPYLALWLAGALFWLAAIYWLLLPHWATSVGWLALSFYQAFYLPVFIGLSRVAVQRLRVPAILAAPVVWTGLELARGHLLTGFTLASLGHTQYRWIGLIQISDLTGAYGVSFVVMFAAACLARMFACDEAPAARWPLVPLAVVLGSVLGYGHLRTSIPPLEPQARFALIQGSIDSALKYDPSLRGDVFEHYMNVCRQAVGKAAEKGQRPDLIVWPETMFPQALISVDDGAEVSDSWRAPGEESLSREEVRRRRRQDAVMSRSFMAVVAEQLGAALLLGVDSVDFGPSGYETYNSAAYVSRSGELLGRYDKIHLVMFGEYVPFARRFPWLQRFTPLPSSLSAGWRPEAFELGSLRIAPNICYETVLPHVIRRQVTALAAEGREPDVLVNLTNDGWFWGSAELDMHLICGIFRAVECRKPLLIAANTGFSAWIDGDGRVLARGPRRAPGFILADVGPDPRRSFYLRHGDWFAGICLRLCEILILASLALRWRWLRNRVAAWRGRG